MIAVKTILLWLFYAVTSYTFMYFTPFGFWETIILHVMWFFVCLLLFFLMVFMSAKEKVSDVDIKKLDERYFI